MSLVVEDVDSFVRKRGRKRRGVEVEKDGKREMEGGGVSQKEEKGPKGGRKVREGERKKKKKQVCMSQCLDFLFRSP